MRDATVTFCSYLRGLFQSERASMLRMSEVSKVDHQVMQHMLTSSAIDWNEFGGQIARETGARLYLPEHWVSDTDRCNKASIPEEHPHYQSKCEIALSMIETSQTTRGTFWLYWLKLSISRSEGTQCQTVFCQTESSFGII